MTELQHKIIKIPESLALNSIPELIKRARAYTEPQEVKAMGLYPYFIPASGRIGPRTLINGKETIMLGSNNYMGLINHPEMIQAVKDAVDKYGTGCTGSRFLNGTLDLHLELEEKLAKFLEKDRVLTYSTGFQTNQGTITAMVGKDDYIISDTANHASIVDACRLSKAQIIVYEHNNMEDLEHQLRNLPRDAGKLIVSDGVFSMEGDIAKIPQLVELKDQYNAVFMIDDAHSVGVLGPHGEGTGHHFKLVKQIDIITGTFSKSFASLGGFAAASEEIINYVQHHARALIFSASSPPTAVAATLKALELIAKGDDRRTQLMQNAHSLRSKLQAVGFHCGESQTPIVPVLIGDQFRTFTMFRELLEAGVYTNPVRPPAVPVGYELLRTSLMATHTEQDIVDAVEIFERIGRKVKVLKKKIIV